MLVAIYGTKFNQHSADVTQSLLSVLQKFNIQVAIYEPLNQFLHTFSNISFPVAETFRSHDDLPSETRFMMSVGGDGTFLNSITIVRDKGIPIVGINIGRLGFLATVAASELSDFVEKLVSDQYALEERTLLHLNAKEELFGDFPYALNDMVIQKQATGLITIHTWINNEFLNSFWADGLIVASPTGSSAYSMSVGGPVVAPNTQNLIISPIAPHNLSIRPLIISDRDILRFKPECRGNRFIVTLDSRSAECPCGTEIEIKKADFKVKIVKSASFYTTLRNKLMWGADMRN